MSRPTLEIDPGQVEELAAIGCTYEDIASVVGCSTKTLQRRFVQSIKKGQTRLNVSLCRAQIKLALSGNVSMLIWLGKQHLGQSEKAENVNIERPLDTVVVIGAKR